MATGPDPNRWQESDPDADGGRNLGDLPSTRFGFPSWLAALLMVAALAFVVKITIF